MAEAVAAADARAASASPPPEANHASSDVRRVRPSGLMSADESPPRPTRPTERRRRLPVDELYVLAAAGRGGVGGETEGNDHALSRHVIGVCNLLCKSRNTRVSKIVTR